MISKAAVRWFSRAAWVVGLALLGWFGYARVTTPPAAGYPVADGRIAALQDALDRLPWSGVDGDFLSEGAPIPTALREYVSDNKAALDVLADQARRLQTFPEWGRDWNLARGAQNGWNALALRALVQADAGEYHDAVESIEALRSCEGVRNDWWFGRENFDYALLIRLLQDHDLPPGPAERLIAALEAKGGLDETELLLRHHQLDRGVDAWLDRYFTAESDGGWMVVNAVPARDWFFGSTVDVERSRGWNLLSPLFVGRSEMRLRLEEFIALIEGQAEARLVTVDLNYRGSVLEGPLLGRLRGTRPASAVTYTGLRRALVVMTRLSQYRQEHGRYPDTLDELPQPLPKDVPTGRNPSRRPFEYQRDPATETYALPSGQIDYYGHVLFNAGQYNFVPPARRP